MCTSTTFLGWRGMGLAREWGGVGVGVDVVIDRHAI